MKQLEIKGKHAYKTNSLTIVIALLSGILAAFLYTGMTLLCGRLYDGYDPLSQTISELSAIDAPTRSLWGTLGIFYAILSLLFSWGIWQCAANKNRLQKAGLILGINAVLGFFWPPMHQRHVLAAGGGTFTDIAHIAFAIVTVAGMLAVIILAASAFGQTFRIYSVVTILVLLTTGILTARSSPAMESNLPTPWMGVWERISIGVYFLWTIVLSLLLLNRKFKSSSAA